MLKKIASRLVPVLIILALAAAPSFAEPVAKVKDFPGGEGVAEFLESLEGVEIAAAFVPYDYADTAIVVVPLSEGSTVELYGALLDEEYRVVPDREDMLANAPAGWGLPFWCIVPEGIPNMVVVVTDAEGNEYTWFPFYSGEDGSFVTDEEFIPF
ncbi:MAG: hypothetical protein ACOX5A_01420 [Aminivibrio sp.]